MPSPPLFPPLPADYPPRVPPPPFLADHLAIDLLNSEAMLDGQLTELLYDDSIVRYWLREAGLLPDRTALPRTSPGELTALAIRLRRNIRELIEQRRAGELLQLELLNEFLREGREQTSLARRDDGVIVLHRTFDLATARSVFLPVALSAADLLVNGNIDLVRVCEANDCVLSFYDRTKSHRRRWCSAGTCGNRDKVNRFRARAALRR
jgi:predicted RNA-binding Zn ribbon-like protein